MEGGKEKMEGSILQAILPFALIFVLFYFILIRPNNKRQKAVQEMQSNLQKGDKIVTIGGLHGTVHAVEEGKITIQCGDGTKLTFDRAAIKEVVQPQN